MAWTRRRKVCVVLALLLAFVFFVLPAALGVGLRGTVEEKLKAALNAPVALGGLTVHLFPPGATLANLEVGGSSPLTGGAPLARIQALRATVAWSTVFGGGAALTGLRLGGTELHLGADDKGHATLAEFLANLPAPGTEPLPLGTVDLRDATVTLHAPRRQIMPESALEPEPVTVGFERLYISDLTLPAPGQGAARETWSDLELSGLAVRSPLHGLPDVPPLEAAGSPMAEGLALERLRGEFQIPAQVTSPLHVRGVKVEGLACRNVLRGPKDAETLTRVQAALAVCLRTPPAKTGGPKRPMGNGIFLADLASSASAVEVQGLDGNGKPAFWRLADLKLDISRLALGPAAAGEPGHLKISSPTRSSEGDDELRIEWSDVRGGWPKLSFGMKADLRGIALPPLSARVERTASMGVVKGVLASSFAGKTTDGKVEWDGSVTISKDTQLSGRGFNGSVSSQLAQFATGNPIGTIRIRGTLDNPKVAMPDFLAGAGYSLLQSAVQNAPLDLLGTLGKGMESSVLQGVREADKVLQKLPGLGGLLGGSKEGAK